MRLHKVTSESCAWDDRVKGPEENDEHIMLQLFEYPLKTLGAAFDS